MCSRQPDERVVLLQASRTCLSDFNVSEWLAFDHSCELSRAKWSYFHSWLPSADEKSLGQFMPSSHLPRTPCDKFVYDFPCDFLGIVHVGGYGLRHMCSHCLRALCDFFYGASRATRGKSVQRLCGDCTEIVQCQCSCRAVSAASARKSYRARAGIVQCHLRHVYGLRAYDFFKFVKLLAKPNRRGRGARESVRKSHSRLLPPHGGLAEAARKGRYGQDTGSVDPSQAKMWTRHYWRFCVKHNQLFTCPYSFILR